MRQIPHVSKQAIVAAVMLWMAATVSAAARVEPTPVARPGENVWIQVAAHIPGMHESQWRTDLGLRNVADETAFAEVRLYPADGSPVKSATTYVPAGAQSILVDVVDQFGHVGAGALEVASDQPVIVTSRTYNRIAAGADCTPGGTFGQYYAGHRVGDGLAAGESAWLAHLAESPRFRSNLAFTNMGENPATVAVELFDEEGVSLAAFGLALDPAGYRQETRVFWQRAGREDVERGSASVTVTGGSGLIVSASVVDNTTNDPTTIPMRRSTAFEPPVERITVMLPGEVPLALLPMPAGTFMMGSPEWERGRHHTEGPQHQVTLTRDFYLGEYPVTQRQWLAVMGSNPSRFTGCGLDCPVESVSWNDICGGATGDSCVAESFIGRLNAHLADTGQPGAGKFRMPTEAEWEYGARAGSTTAFSFETAGDWDMACGDFPEADAYMWWCGNSGATTHPVGGKLPNAWGLHDVHGNVWEWVADWFGVYPSGPVTDPTGPAGGSDRVRRGGSWGSFSHFCRSAMRYDHHPSLRHDFVGFRLARSR